jgi:hypothetical protein
MRSADSRKVDNNKINPAMNLNIFTHVQAKAMPSKLKRANVKARSTKKTGVGRGY